MRNNLYQKKSIKDKKRFPIRIYFYILFVFFLNMPLLSCRKMVEIDEPVNSLTTSGVFSTDATAISAVVGIYSKLINTDGTLMFGSGATTLYAGLASDELSKVGLPNSSIIGQFFSNNLLPDNGLISSQLWMPAYFTIYQTNSALEELNTSNTITPTLKQQLEGECKFLRAFAYFYLSNLWGDIPMPLTGDWNQTYFLSRTSKTEIYNQIIIDLKDAESLLKSDYSISSNERIQANKFAATALLARVYLYQQDWINAESKATTVINNNSLYGLDSNLNNVFLRNSFESILQLQPSNKAYPRTVLEGNIIPEFPFYYLTNTMANSFEVGDKRKTAWTTGRLVSGVPVLQPNKYKVAFGSPTAIPTEYYTLLRLGEIYLIRAEARAQQNKINESQTDVNVIRTRAGLTQTNASDKASLLLAIEQERRVELFAEWGHRWLDLIRTNRANSVLSAIKGSNWQTTDQLYPIPKGEIQKNSNLTQNPGY